jgi:hypothetical protein
MKRNTYIKFSLLILFFSSILSCSDLKQEPVGLLTPNIAFASVGDVEKGVFGSYAFLADEHLWGRQYSITLLLRDDMCDIGERNTVAERVQFNDFTVNSRNFLIDEFWQRAYQVISAANTAIFGGEKLAVAPEKINPLIAEAKFNKAFMYYHMVRAFGGLPYIDAFIEDPMKVATIKKTSEDDVYANIINDLKYAKQWLPERRTPDVRSRATKGTAAAYLASVYLTRGNWQEAYTEAKYVIDNKALFGYDLMEDFKLLFDGPKADGLKEHIFAIDFKSNFGAEPVNVDFLPALTGVRTAFPDGWSICVPSDKVYNTWDKRDYRKVISFDTTAVINKVRVPISKFPTVQRAHIGKYANTGGGTNVPGDTDHNYADMRYAEILFIAAEALNEISGPTPEAIGYVNEVRKRARNWNGKMTDFPADVPAGITKEAFLDLILDDRRLELAFELNRWFDIKRRKLGDKVFKGDNSLEPHLNFNANRDYYYPFPQSELDNYPSFGPQNPGY